MAKTRVPKKVGASIHPRAGWDAAFAKMATCGDDALLDDPTSTEWDEGESRTKSTIDPFKGKKIARPRGSADEIGAAG